MLLEWKLRRHLADGYLERPNQKHGADHVLSGSPATDMVRTGAKQGNLRDHRGSGGHKGPGIQCRDYPARVAGGVAGGGRSTQQGLWEPEIHGDPGVRQLSASGCLAARSKRLARARMYRVSWVLSLAGARLGGPSLSFSILACEKL